MQKKSSFYTLNKLQYNSHTTRSIILVYSVIFSTATVYGCHHPLSFDALPFPQRKSLFMIILWFSSPPVPMLSRWAQCNRINTQKKKTFPRCDGWKQAKEISVRRGLDASLLVLEYKWPYAGSKGGSSKTKQTPLKSLKEMETSMIQPRGADHTSI